MRGLTIIVVEASTVRLHAALSIAAVAAATGAPTRLHLHGEAARLLAPPVVADEDDGYVAAGLPTLAQLLDEALGLGVAVSVCQTGLVMASIAAAALDARIEASGLVGVMAALDEGRLMAV